MDREDLQQKTVAELRDEAKKIPDAKGLSSMKKDELIDLILSQSAGARAPKRAGGGKSAVDKGGKTGKLGKSDIKHRIKLLKAEKREALSQNDRERVKSCNKQIHDFKRMLRRITRGSAAKR